MKNAKIKISDTKVVHVPINVRMNIAEIAELFEIFYQTAKKNIRSVEELSISTGDQSMSGRDQNRLRLLRFRYASCYCFSGAISQSEYFS